MINYNMALTESIKAAVTELHNKLLINEGYANLAQLSQRQESLERVQQPKMAVGQDWFSAINSDHESGQLQVVRDDLCEACATPLADLLVVCVVPAFDEQQRRCWAVTYGLRHGDFIYSVSARLSQWMEPSVQMLGWPFETKREADKDDEPFVGLPPELRDQALEHLQHLIYEQVTKLHECHLASGYSRQKAAYKRFVMAVKDQGYLVSGVERFRVVSTHEAFGHALDPEDTEEAFRDAWIVPMEEMMVLTAEYFPTEDGLDRWYVAYQLTALAITLNIFVKFYPHRRPQVEIVSN